MMHRWSIGYYAESGETKTLTVEAPTAADALTIFDITIMRKRVHTGSMGPLVGDVYAIAYIPERGPKVTEARCVCSADWMPPPHQPGCPLYDRDAWLAGPKGTGSGQGGA